MIFRCFSIMFFSVFLSLSVYAEVLYENPVENVQGHDLMESSLQELLEKVEGETVDESSRKAKYLLGLVYLNGWEPWKQEPDADKGIQYLQEVWECGVADAGLSLAYEYYYGKNVEKDNKKAFYYLESSAKEGYLKSQRELGRGYLGNDWDGLVSINVEKAMSWLERATNAGDLRSANILANIYYMGDEVEKNFESSFYWLKKSSESKYGVSMSSFLTLAEFYQEGIGTDVDLIEAYKYYDLASPAGDADKAQLAKDMTQEQIAEATRLSREWQEEHNIFVPSYDGLEHQPDGSYR